MASFSSLALTVLDICAFKVQKTEHFFGKFTPNKISKSGDKIFDFWVFQNWVLSSYFAISPEPLDMAWLPHMAFTP